MAEPNGEPPLCDVCGRSMLAGERTRTYVDRDHERHEVCDLCVVRAESIDWVPIEDAGRAAPVRATNGGGRVRRLIGRARESAVARSRDRGEADPTQAADGRAEAPELRERRERIARRLRDARSSAGSPEPETGETPRPRRRSVPQKPERRIKRAFEGFNESQYRRTVSGLIRSLGGPWVTAVSTDDEPGLVRITVAWELSWYQWEVDLTADGNSVRELARGDEVGELDEADRAWNAHAAEDGELRFGVVGSTAAG
jgi:hypothetical protein